LDTAVAAIAASGSRAFAKVCDLRDEEAVGELFDDVAAECGVPDLVVYNAGAQYRESILKTRGDMFEKVWRLSCFGGFLVGREAARRMLSRGSGTVIFTGATASTRGGANFAAFASAKFALRALAQSMARELGPQGIHVAHVVIDGAIDMPRIHKLFPDLAERTPEDGLLKPDDIASSYVAIHKQPRSAWTFELDLRPWAEKF
jgi:NAD(P)-dependent dehydrogenase (short-subunit alcohol dehydrogenase family)